MATQTLRKATVLSYPSERQRSVHDTGPRRDAGTAAPAMPYDLRAAPDRHAWPPPPAAGGTSIAFEAKMDQRTITSLFESAERGDAAAAEELFAALYAELHRLARRELAHRGRNVTLGVTTLLHEAYLKMSGREELAFPDRARFMAYAGRVMRRLIIDHVRRRQARKRGGMFDILVLETTVAGQVANEHELQRISDALDELATVDPALAEVVDLKFFCGFSFAEIGTMRDVSERTVQRQWEKARLYLHRAIGDAISMGR
jgi:RNA polymerase sigma factor (TIGR02999 family)